MIVAWFWHSSGKTLALVLLHACCTCGILPYLASHVLAPQTEYLLRPYPQLRGRREAWKLRCNSFQPHLDSWPLGSNLDIESLHLHQLLLRASTSEYVLKQAGQHLFCSSCIQLRKLTAIVVWKTQESS